MNSGPFRFSVTSQELSKYPGARAVLSTQVAVDQLAKVAFQPSHALKGLLCRDIYGDKPFGAFILNDATLTGPAALICTSSGELIREQNAGLLEHEELFQAMELFAGASSVADPVKLEDAVSLISTCTECFWHWMMDSLPKVVLAEEIGFSGTYIIPPGKMGQTYLESLSLLGIDSARCVTCAASQYQAKRLWIPTYFSGFNAHFNSEFIRRYRERVLSAVQVIDESPGQMYVARKPNARSRRVVNHESVVSALKGYGFSPVYFEDLSLREQIAVASRASIMVAPHGSGMTHSLFMPERSTVIECFPFQRQASCDCYEQLATVMNHRYQNLESTRDRGDDLEVDVDQLLATVKNCLG